MPKRTAHEAGHAGHGHAPHKRARAGIRAALPTTDDAWRRKLERAKEATVRRAKTRQTYAKVKARVIGGAGGDSTGEASVPSMHPDRQARLGGEGDVDGDQGDKKKAGGNADENSGGNADENADEHADEHIDSDDNSDAHSRPSGRPSGRRASRPPKRTPAYFQKAREEAEQKRAAIEAKRAERARRAAEREAKLAERARRQRAMAKARRPAGLSTAAAHQQQKQSQAGSSHAPRRKLGRESGVLLDRVRRLMGK